jgi:predicted nucleic acid-binding protein
MTYLLDTCVLSEFARKIPDPKVLHWVESIEEDHLFISVLTIGEIKKGIELLPASNRKAELSVWLNEGLLKRFNSRIYPIDTEVMLVWGTLYAGLQISGHLIPLIDSLIASVALVNHANLVTRNENDFRSTGVQIINPWL